MRWRCAGRSDGMPPHAAASPAADQERIVSLLIGEAQAQIALAAGNSDSHDVKALGLLGIDVAVIAGLTASRPALPPLWWIAVVGLAVCVPFLLLTIASGEFALGPDLDALYAKGSQSRPLDTAIQLLAELRSSLAGNRRLLRPKRRVFTLGLALFVRGCLFAAVFLLRVSM